MSSNTINSNDTTDFHSTTALVWGLGENDNSRTIAGLKANFSHINIVILDNREYDGKNEENEFNNREFANRNNKYPNEYLINYLNSGDGKQVDIIRNIDSKYLMLVAAGIYPSGGNFMKYFNRFENRDRQFAFFKHRVMVCSTGSKIYDCHNQFNFPRPLPFHLSAGWLFGFSEDVKDYLLGSGENSKFIESYDCKYPDRKPMDGYRWRFTPEQHICLGWVRKHYDGVVFEDYSDWNWYNCEIADRIYASNFIFLDADQIGIVDEKASEDMYSSGEYISHLYFLKKYRKYCDNLFEIPLNYSSGRRKEYKKYCKTMATWKSKPECEREDELLKIKTGDCIPKKSSYIMGRYDMVVALKNCRPTHYEDIFKLRFTSFPLDWMYNFDLFDVVNLFRGNFKSFLRRVSIKNERLEIDVPHMEIEDLENNFLAMHHYRKQKNFESEQKRVYELMQRRSRRFIKLLKLSRKVCFIVSEEDKNLIKYFVDQMVDRFPNLEIDILNMLDDKNSTYLLRNIEEYENSRIVTYRFNDSYGGEDEKTNYWLGCESCWMRIMATLKTSWRFKFYRFIFGVKRILSKLRYGRRRERNTADGL